MLVYAPQGLSKAVTLDSLCSKKSPAKGSVMMPVKQTTLLQSLIAHMGTNGEMSQSPFPA